MKLTKKGFTLIELMVVIVIVGILAAVAIPKFTVASHKAKASEFPTVVASVYSAEHTYQAEIGTYIDCTNETDLKNNLGCEVPSSKWFSYKCNATAGTSFSSTAGVRSAFGKAAVGDLGVMTDAGVKTVSGGLTEYVPNWK
jgi:prepilin-type N-terminal cleavage/methylation domain-containing protein